MVKTKLVSKKKTVHLKLTGDLTIESAVKIKAALKKALAKKKDVVVEMEEVGSVDLSFLQTLSAAHKSAQKKGIGFGVGSKLPEPFTRAASEAGFSPREKYFSVSG